MAWLGAYWAATPGVRLADNATLRLDADNEFQPDALLRLPEQAGGKSRVSRDDGLEGAPEWVVGVASISASYDLHDQRKVYRRNGVREYLVWLVREKRPLWFVLEVGEYRPLQHGRTGCCTVGFFRG